LSLFASRRTWSRTYSVLIQSFKTLLYNNNMIWDGLFQTNESSYRWNLEPVRFFLRSHPIHSFADGSEILDGTDNMSLHSKLEFVDDGLSLSKHSPFYRYARLEWNVSPGSITVTQSWIESHIEFSVTANKTGTSRKVSSRIMHDSIFMRDRKGNTGSAIWRWRFPTQATLKITEVVFVSFTS
jgi:hypothetical protein